MLTYAGIESNLVVMLVAALVGGLLGVGLGLAAWYSKRKSNDDPILDRINQLLPQTQCAGCGYAGCRPYAEAIWAGDAINKCTPGGEPLIQALATLLGRPLQAPDLNYGQPEAPHVAFIHEQDCIGCGRCLSVCPVDAIVGAPEYMHTIISTDCTGCDLCIPECPVDCIDKALVEIPKPEVAAPLATEQACIRCGYCDDACPVDLSAQKLYQAATASTQEEEALASLSLSSCIECGRCERACPSQLPLTAIFHHAKQATKTKQQADVNANQAQKRFHLRQQRFKQAETERMDRRQQRLSHLQVLHLK